MHKDDYKKKIVIESIVTVERFTGNVIVGGHRVAKLLPVVS